MDEYDVGEEAYKRGYEKGLADADKRNKPMKLRETRCALMCQNCGHKVTEKGCAKLDRNYCKTCGQALDWSEDE